MLFFDACSGGEVTAFVLRVHGAAAQQHVVALFGGSANLPDPIWEGSGTQRYEDFGNHDLTNAPVIEVVVTMHDETDATVEARCGECAMRLALPPSRSLRGGSVRPATAHECVELGLRWCLGLDRFGCFDPLETIFWGEHVHAEAWCVQESIVFDEAVPMPNSYLFTTQVWLSRFPQEKHIDAVNRIFGTESGDAFCVSGDHFQKSDDAQPRHQVLVAAFTRIEGAPPSRFATHAER